jgi:hypothetical protein
LPSLGSQAPSFHRIYLLSSDFIAQKVSPALDVAKYFSEHLFRVLKFVTALEFSPFHAQMQLKRTPLYDLHVKHGAKMTGFAGWDMPLQYEDGILQSHLHCREKASLFDVSHMGQIRFVHFLPHPL